MSKSTKKMIIALILAIATLISSVYTLKLSLSYQDRVVGMVIYKYYDIENDSFHLVLSNNIKHQVYPKDFMTHNLGDTFDKSYRSLKGFPLFVLSALLMVLSISLFIVVIDLIKYLDYGQKVDDSL